MKECNVILQAGVNASALPTKLKYTLIESKTYYQYFCLKLACFRVWFSEKADKDMKCPYCGESKDVVFRDK